MAANGVLDFQSTNKLIFRGANANVVIDTQNLSLGVGHQGEGAITSNLFVTGNAHVSTDLSVGGEVKGGYDTNTTSYFGRAAVGYCGHNDAMTICHIDSNNNGGYALLQEANGETMLNSASGQSVHIRQGNVNKLVINSSGNVGIGTNSPNATLDVNGSTRSGYNSDTTSYFGRSAIGYTGHSDWASFAHIDRNAINDYALLQNSIGRTILNCAANQKISFSCGDTAKMTMTDGGDLGIGTISPAVRLHAYHGTSTARIIIQRGSNSGECNLTLSGYHSSGSTEWQIYHVGSTDNLRFWRGGDKGYISYNANGGSLNFTGQHRTFIKDTPFTQAATLEGLIVSSNQNKYIRMSGGIEAGSNAVTINEALPLVSISTTSCDKKCFGVVSLSEDPETREESYGNFTSRMEKEDGDTRIYINSVGEGGIWVSNVNGPLEAGDYITTSILPGYGMKQDDDLLHNYTVAKITMDCDFNPPDNPIQKIKKKQGTKRYWRSSSGEETTQEKEGFDELIEREELVNDLDEHSQIQWEDHPTETEKAYKIRYLDASGVETDEANAVHKAAFVGCTYHCG